MDFNLDSYNHQQGIFAVTTDCKIPATEEGALTSTMTCTGTLPSDCDTYSQGLAYSIATGEKFGAIFLHMDEATAKGHIAFAFFWSIIGTICTWLGLVLLLYSEIKAVTVVSCITPSRAQPRYSPPFPCQAAQYSRSDRNMCHQSVPLHALAQCFRPPHLSPHMSETV